MLIDNKFYYDEDFRVKTVWEFIKKYSEPEGGNIDLVTGFFSVAGLDVLRKELSPDMKYRMIVGDITNDDTFMDHVIDLLQGDAGIESALQLSDCAKNAVEFLKKATVEVRAVNNSFCHAKAYLYRPFAESKYVMQNSYCISGSSNLTEAGLGIKQSSNIELNTAETGAASSTYKQLRSWFGKQWDEVAKTKLEVKQPDGKNKLIDVKQYFIEQIENIFKEYTPEQIYYKILYEMFRSNIEIEDKKFREEIAHLEYSVIYRTLFEYQKKGVISLVKMLNNYGGAILADAVGLGKTFSALGVIKYFQNNGYTCVVLCPKKLENNWTQYLDEHGSRFDEDHFRYHVRFHTDLQGERLQNNYKGAKLSWLHNNVSKLLIVIDESHNLRNDKSGRYKYLMDELVAYKKDGVYKNVKVLELSATPINNRLVDVRNQFKIIAKGADDAFDDETFNVRSLTSLFKEAESKFKAWCVKDNRKLNDLIEEMPRHFFDLTDKLIVARTRNLIEKTLEEDLGFPQKQKPDNRYKGLQAFGCYNSVDEIYDAMMASYLTAYQPSKYLEPKSKKKDSDWQDNVYRERYLVRMMVILFMKRLESSWFSCMKTMGRVLDVHKNTLDKVNAYLAGRNDVMVNTINDQDFENEEADDCEIANVDFVLSKAGVKLSDMKLIEYFKEDLENDIKCLESFYDNLVKFNEDFNNGMANDEKLEDLVSLIKHKQGNVNKKVVVFTAYSDTAQYIYNQLLNKFGFKNIAMITGNDIKSMPDQLTKDRFVNVLERFAPYSKLFKEKDWNGLYVKAGLDREKYFDVEKNRWNVDYEMWRQCVAKYGMVTKQNLDNNIDILIATDCISEGQNLQDADMVINYDIHWNPVRLIQRLGRIDRIGSPNKFISCVNYWPTNDFNSYLKLESRIENRMATMKLIGAETQEITDHYMEMVKDNPLIEKSEAKLLEDLKNNSISDIEDSDQSFGMQNLSYEVYRQDLLEYIKHNQELFNKMPCGVFSGFRLPENLFDKIPESLVAIVGYPHKPQGKVDFSYDEFYLMCQPVDRKISSSPMYVEMNKTKVLELLRINKKQERYVPEWIEKSDRERVDKLSDILKDWMRFRMMKDAYDTARNPLEFLTSLKTGTPIDTLDNKFKIDNFDLIVWEYITSK